MADINRRRRAPSSVPIDPTLPPNLLPTLSKIAEVLDSLEKRLEALEGQAEPASDEAIIPSPLDRVTGGYFQDGYLILLGRRAAIDRIVGDTPEHVVGRIAIAGTTTTTTAGGGSGEEQVTWRRESHADG